MSARRVPQTLLRGSSVVMVLATLLVFDTSGLRQMSMQRLWAAEPVSAPFAPGNPLEIVRDRHRDRNREQQAPGIAPVLEIAADRWTVAAAVPSRRARPSTGVRVGVRSRPRTDAHAAQTAHEHAPVASTAMRAPSAVDRPAPGGAPAPAPAPAPVDAAAVAVGAKDHVHATVTKGASHVHAVAGEVKKHMHAAGKDGSRGDRDSTRKPGSDDRRNDGRKVTVLPAKPAEPAESVLAGVGRGAPVGRDFPATVGVPAAGESVSRAAAQAVPRAAVVATAAAADPSAVTGS